MDIQTIYHSLRQARCCSSAYDFSENYLGKTRSYYSVLKAREKEPSLEAVLNLEYKIGKLEENLLQSNDINLEEAAGKLKKIGVDVARYRDQRCEQNVRRNDRRLG